MGEVIPLFPLGTPLFPGIVLPLVVFEPRYRRLMRDLLAQPEDGSDRFFGVVAIRQGWEVERVAPAEALYDVGCTARLQVIRPQPDGGFRILTVGGERFRLLDVVVGAEPPYLQGEIEWLADEEAAEADAGDDDTALLTVLLRGVGELFARYVAEVSTLEEGSPDEVEEQTSALLRAVEGDPRALSFLVGSAALLTTEDRQALLAESATRRRLAAESRLLRRELTLLQTIGAVPASLQQFAAPMTVN